MNMKTLYATLLIWIVLFGGNFVVFNYVSPDTYAIWYQHLCYFIAVISGPILGYYFTKDNK